MSETTYTIRIKKEYASAILEDLKQVDAIEILEVPIPEWQQNETLKRLAELKSNPSLAINEENFLKILKGEDE